MLVLWDIIPMESFKRRYRLMHELGSEKRKKRFIGCVRGKGGGGKGALV